MNDQDRHVRKKIKQIEGFTIRVLWPDGTDVRGDYVGAKSYRFIRGARDRWTVARWKKERFKHSNPQFFVEVFFANNSSVHGRTLLQTVRSGYR